MGLSSDTAVLRRNNQAGNVMHYPLVSFLITYQKHGLLSKKTNKKSSLDKGSLGLQMHDKSAKNDLDKLLVSLLNLDDSVKSPSIPPWRDHCGVHISSFIPKDLSRCSGIDRTFSKSSKMKIRGLGGNIYGN
jgi:hypothetical protein